MFPQIFGKYVLEREIAAGGMARVYLATLRGAVGFEKRLVVKQIRSELASDTGFVARFVEEAKTAVELSHPNIVPVYELGVEQGVYYIAMELCEGLTLSDVLAETGPLGPAEGAYLGAEICRALDYAHRRANIVHRDVTPRNVMIDDEGAVRLIDFGIAAPVTPASDDSRGEVFGSPGHMPPEQLSGAKLSAATDVFAVGALLIEAWTGRPPFRRATALDSERALSDAPPPVDRHHPELAALRDLISASVALDARHRPRDAEQFARPLREFSKREDSGDIARRLGARVRRARRSGRVSSPWLPGDSMTRPRAALPLDAVPPATGSESAGASSRAEHAAASTLTFAARGELELWTRKLQSSPGLPVAPAAEPAAKRPTTGPTRPETDRHESSARTIELAVFGLGAALFVAASFMFAPRLRSVAVDAPETAQKRTLPAPSAVARESTGAPSATAVAAVRAELLPSHDPHPRNARAPAPASESDREQAGTLKLTADPSSKVELNGTHVHQQGQTPLVVSGLRAGRYQVIFRNATFAGPLGTEVTVVASGTRGVHADFRQAEPTVSVR